MSNPFSPKLKKISVITPVYKDAHKTFPQFFQALNEQDYKHFEVIVSFDGKNVTGVKKLKKMMKKYPGLDIKFIVNKWGGAPAARNRGAKEATGDFLTFLDPDIYPYSDTFRFWVNSFEENKDKDVIWGLYEVIENGQKLQVGGGCPTDNGDNPIYWAFRFSNYCS
jgi:glycosyltransferase involved in cell wall biosynthesis